MGDGVSSHIYLEVIVILYSFWLLMGGEFQLWGLIPANGGFWTRFFLGYFIKSHFVIMAQKWSLWFLLQSHVLNIERLYVYGIKVDPWQHKLRLFCNYTFFNDHRVHLRIIRSVRFQLKSWNLGRAVVLNLGSRRNRNTLWNCVISRHFIYVQSFFGLWYHSEHWLLCRKYLIHLFQRLSIFGFF